MEYISTLEVLNDSYEASNSAGNLREFVESNVIDLDWSSTLMFSFKFFELYLYIEWIDTVPPP